MTNVASYADYFRQLARRHHKLLHDPQVKGQSRFARWSSEEVLEGLRAKITFPAMLVELYELTTKSEQAYSVGAYYKGAVSIFATGKDGDYNSIEAAYDLAEEILNDVLAQMWQDHYGPDKDRCNTPFRSLNFDGMNIIPAGPVWESQYGWRCEFSFLFNHIPKFTTPPAEGVFVNLP